ncbi:hypothetical protein IRP63_14785 (plasmid) [Clostridium botulinum]|uniref:hypothetical protein n=1 Tax=Clostridium botulinum TaxID=1491 RepID=UPI0018F1EB30|nr:hypothetical protein [Clostridium botulinum]MCD3316240.1 hypothetical protein [Clostridium botulinum D/C]QPW59086.1 hypothetical protein IRP63_14785 [Clostridium botulinum]
MATAKKKEELKETEVPQENETIITKKSESKNKEDNKPLARKDLRKLITNDLEIVIMNNTNNKFTYECPRTHRMVLCQYHGHEKSNFFMLHF